MAKTPAKKSRDVNEIAKNIIDQMTGDAPREVPPTKNPAAVELGRRGGLKGRGRACRETFCEETERDREEGSCGTMEEYSR